jgi:hypothetical protein
MVSKPDIGKGPYQAVQFMRTKASGYPSCPESLTPLKAKYISADQIVILRFSLATLRRTIRSDKTPFLRHYLVRMVVKPVHKIRFVDWHVA